MLASGKVFVSGKPVRSTPGSQMMVNKSFGLGLLLFGCPLSERVN